jgi:hypothetical protein
MVKFERASFLVAFYAIAGCTSFPDAPRNRASDPILSVEMSRSECFWRTCPHYDVRIMETGEVTYDGHSAVRTTGHRVRQITPLEFKTITDTIESMRFDHLASRYTAKSEGCKEIWSDAPTANFTVTRQSASKTVLFYYGCRGGKPPQSLAMLVDVIEKKAGIHEWVYDPEQ